MDVGSRPIIRFLLTRLLLYGYSIGVTSSRAIEKATYDNVVFRYLAADQHPDHDTIASFRQEHLEALAGLFVQGLRLCSKAGLIQLGSIAIDGTKMLANASTRHSVSHQKLGEQEQYWKAVGGWPTLPPAFGGGWKRKLPYPGKHSL